MIVRAAILRAQSMLWPRYRCFKIARELILCFRRDMCSIECIMGSWSELLEFSTTCLRVPWERVPGGMNMAGVVDDNGMSHHVGLDRTRSNWLTLGIGVMVHVPSSKDIAEALVKNCTLMFPLVLFQFPSKSFSMEVLPNLGLIKLSFIFRTNLHSFSFLSCTSFVLLQYERVVHLESFV